MKIIADENMPLVEPLFADFGELTRLPGRQLSPASVAEADVLLVRSVTQVDERLLSQAAHLKFVGSATIGTDHVDQALLARRGIRFASAPGCNKISVGEYVISALLVLAERHQLHLSGMTLGVIGAGNTGTAVAERALALGMQVCLCDPPLADAGDPREFVPYEVALCSDVVSFHVPLTREGPYATWHLLDEAALSVLDGEQILINACRGDVWDNQALLARQLGADPLRLVMDVWEQEPDLLTALIPHTELATPHIAGYSLEGKMRGTYQIYQAFCDWIGQPAQQPFAPLLPKPALDRLALQQLPDQDLLKRLVHLVYDVRRDDALFRHGFTTPADFDRLRKHYPERREWSSLHLLAAEGREHLAALGFSLATPA
ncbi:4-phosphoerythronate dehydrogenase [Pseudaeromonas paramecii]|uniref:Erythronate-4-phosphate dehydrogenase n=1 Tax=Pseudaeromonas paramecii TaxID=2138166 RepID=A0ABP8PZU5_9GAMM